VENVIIPLLQALQKWIFIIFHYIPTGIGFAYQDPSGKPILDFSDTFPGAIDLKKHNVGLYFGDGLTPGSLREEVNF
jgi:hypothetical protein